jgi:hypothetical protein
LRERQKALRTLIGKTPPEGIVFSDPIEGDVGSLLKQLCASVWKASSRSGWTAPTAPAGARNG